MRTDPPSVEPSGTPYERRLRSLLRDVAEGTVSADEAVRGLVDLPFADLGFARVDHHRELRQGACEIVLAEGKTPEQVAVIVDRLVDGNEGPVLVSRASPAHRRAAMEAAVGRGVVAVEHEVARAVLVPRNVPAAAGDVLILTGGTGDLPVAEEAALVAHAMGAGVQTIADVGVAGLHRVASVRSRIAEADVVVVVAGMEGALASVVGGLATGPVIACPTSVGYGANFGGLAALLSMLASCTPGMACVGIDDGVGAGFVAAQIVNGRRKA